MEIKYKKSCDSLTVYVYGELDECSASNAKNLLDRLLIDNINSKILVYCQMGRRSEEAVVILEDMGYKQVYNLKGGLENIWKNIVIYVFIGII